MRSLHAILFTAALVLTACVSKKSASVPFITPPFPEVKQKYSVRTVSAETGGTLLFKNKGSVVIPPAAFLDLDGKPVVGKVDIYFRQYNRLSEIFLSGLPMTYDTAGVKQNFQSAGMFEIYGNQNGKPVFIAPDKSLQINTISDRMETDQKFYYLDTLTRNWVYQGQASPKPYNEDSTQVNNDSIQANTDAIQSSVAARILKPEKMDKKKFSFDMDVNYTRFPELLELQGFLWQYAENGTDVNDPGKNQWAFSEKWDAVTIDQNPADSNSYIMELKGKSKKCLWFVKPVMKGKAYREAMKAYAKKREQQKLIKKTELFTRTFSIKSFGAYNWDRFYKMDDAVKASFVLRGKKKGKFDQLTQVYFFNGPVFYRYEYSPEKPIEVMYSLSEQTRVATVQMNGEVHMLTVASFRKAVEAGVPKELVLDEYPKAIKSEDDVELLFATMK
jgi:hypothetical protein